MDTPSHWKGLLHSKCIAYKALLLVNQAKRHGAAVSVTSSADNRQYLLNIQSKGNANICVRVATFGTADFNGVDISPSGIVLTDALIILNPLLNKQIALFYAKEKKLVASTTPP